LSDPSLSVLNPSQLRAGRLDPNPIIALIRACLELILLAAALALSIPSLPYVPAIVASGRRLTTTRGSEAAEPSLGVGGGAGAGGALLYPRRAALRRGFDSRGRLRVVHDSARARPARANLLMSASAGRLESHLADNVAFSNNLIISLDNSYAISYRIFWFYANLRNSIIVKNKGYRRY